VDYIDALVRNNQPRKALALRPLVKVEKAPEFGLDALIKSSKQLEEKATQATSKPPFKRKHRLKLSPATKHQFISNQY